MKSLLVKCIVFLVVLFSVLCHLAQGQSTQIWKERDRLPFIKDSQELINSMNRIGLLYQGKDVDSCFYYGMEAKALAVEKGYIKGEIDAENVIAVALNQRGLYQESLEKFSYVLARYRQQKDEVNIVQALMNIASVHDYMVDTVQSGRYYQQAMFEGKGLKNDSIMSLLYANYAYSLSLRGIDSVTYYLNKSREIAKKYKNDLVLLMATQVELDHMLRNGVVDILPLIEETLDQARRLDLETMEVNSLGIMGAYYINDPARAIKYYKEAYDVILSTGIRNLQVPMAYALLDVAKLTGNREEINHAYEFVQNALEEENENLKGFIGDYVEYMSIEEHNKLLAWKNYDQRTKIWFLVVILSVVVILIIFVFRQYKKVRRLNKRIAEQNNDLQTTVEVLEESQEESKHIMEIVAHDLRSPIGAIKMTTSLIEKDVIETADYRKALSMIGQTADKALDLVGELLSVHAKLEESQKESIDVQALLQYCVAMLKHKAMVKNQQIELIAMPVILLGSKEKLWRVFSNLIANAIKFSPVDTAIRVKIEKNNKNVKIAVHDQGVGIQDEMKSKVFDMFTEAKRPGTIGEQSYGLGLAISKQIVESHKGSIWFETHPGLGTTFWVELPLRS